jgi:CCR4-NOT transcription complex subunit 7/8
MPPPGGRFPGHNLSNPFQHINNPLNQGGPQHLQQQHQQGLHHPGFGGGNPGHNLNLFGGHNQSNFQSNALGGGIGGSGLGAAAQLGGGGTGLDGHEARMRFAHGGQMQEALGRGQDGAKGMGQRIRDVWRTNLHQELALLRELVQKYPYISMVSISLFEFFGASGSLGVFDISWKSARFPVDILFHWVLPNLFFLERLICFGGCAVGKC